MQIVIDISEEDYNIMRHNIAVNNPLCPLSQEEMVSKVANGVPLSKGHGDLIDRSDLIPDSDYEDGDFYAVSIGAINGAPTIVEADRSEE